mgnify:CR=1 FL=1
MQIKLDKADTIRIVERHLKIHKEEYAKQLAGWQAAMTEYGQKLKAWSDAGGLAKDRLFEPAKPQSFEAEYELWLRKFSLHQFDIIELDDSEFREVIDNKFTWDHAFLANSATYSSRDK